MFQSRDKANGLWPALFRACGLLVGIATLVAGATDKVRVEKAQVFFIKSGSLSHTLHYSNIKQDFNVRGLYERIEKVRTAVRAKLLTVHFVQPLQNNESRSGHFLEDPTLDNRQKVAHRVEYCLNALLSMVTRLFELFEPVLPQTPTSSQSRNLQLSTDSSQMDLPAPSQEDRANQCHDSHRDSNHLRLRRGDFHLVELERLKAKQQKADVVAKLELMAS
jgi:hypothetical protein